MIGMSEEEKFYDYQIELKGKPKLDVTQPDSETTEILREFRNFQLDSKNFKEFKAMLDTWYAAKVSSMNEQIYELAELFKSLPEFDETNFRFEDRTKMTKDEKLELLIKLPVFTEEWREKMVRMMHMMSKTFTNSIFLIDIIWRANRKMVAFMVNGRAKRKTSVFSVEKPIVPVMQPIPTNEVQEPEKEGKSSVIPNIPKKFEELEPEIQNMLVLKKNGASYRNIAKETGIEYTKVFRTIKKYDYVLLQDLPKNHNENPSELANTTSP